ncbi:MAG: hypothetical protein IJM97_08815 [Clostridia bacterium]|nr:hypothetical protein [Clostridia bacterium]
MKNKKLTVLVSVILAGAIIFSSVVAADSSLRSVGNAEVETADISGYVIADKSDKALTDVLEKASETLLEAVTENTEEAEAEIAEINSSETEETPFKKGINLLVKKLKYYVYGLIEDLFSWLAGGLSDSFPDGPSINEPSEDEPDENSPKVFYPGTATFLDKPAEKAKWSLGYAQEEIMPDNIGEKTYYIAQPNGDKSLTSESQIRDRLKVRAIAISDGSGRGTAVFAVVDCMGLMNKTVREIRAQLSDFAKENNIISINIGATHTHSGIDAMGVYTNTVENGLKNLTNIFFRTNKYTEGPDKEFMELLKNQTVNAIKKACDKDNMKTGTLSYSYCDASQYYYSKRFDHNPDAVSETFARFEFIPDTEGLRPTMIINAEAHPGVIGNKSLGILSADYVAGMDEILNAANYNMIFFPGSIAGTYATTDITQYGFPQIDKTLSESEAKKESYYITSQRYGYVLGLLALYMDKDETEIMKDGIAKKLSENFLGSTKWCEGLEGAGEIILKPLLNIRTEEIVCEITNQIVWCIAKLGIIDIDITNENGKYNYYTEIGYIELGYYENENKEGQVKKIITVPGELTPDLVTGRCSYTAEGSATNKQFEYDPLRKIFDDDELLVFGLTNDEMTYIVPDNDYCRVCFPVFEKTDVLKENRHYAETLSFGKHTASTIVGEFINLLDNLKK